MGLVTIDPHNHKENTEIHKNPQVWCMLTRPVLTEIQPFKSVKINKEIYGHPDAVIAQRPDTHTFLCKF